MKLISFITLVGALFLSASPGISEQPAPDISLLQTTWELRSSKMSCMPDAPSEAPKDRRKFKILSGNQFVWIDYDRASGKVLAMAGGSFEMKGSKYMEKVQFASKEVEGIVGKTFAFEVSFVHHQLIQKGHIGDGVELVETWVRSNSSPCMGLLTQAEAQAKN